ncbi:MAG: toprim domain-containing protein, partial [Proteobacteria bacterium]
MAKPADDQEQIRRKKLFESFRDAYAAAPPAKSSAYLEKKGITEILEHFELRELTDKKVFGKGEGKPPYICFPLMDPRGGYVGLQRIYSDGQKKLTTSVRDGHYRASHAIIGTPERSPVIYIAEGFATAASIFLATGCSVVFAISAGNLDAVTQIIKSRYDSSEIIIAADNDESSSGNTGIYKALETAKKHAVKVIVPPSVDGRKTDFNDIHVLFGIDELRSTLSSNNSLKVPKNHLAHLFQMLAYANRQQMPSLIKQITVLSKAPHFVSETELFEKIKLLTAVRLNDDAIRKNIRAVIIAGNYRAKQIAEIKQSSVDRRSFFNTEKNENGHLVVGEKAVEEILEELDKGHCVILKSPMGTGKTELVIKAALSRVTRGAHVLPRVSVVADASKRLSIDH